MKQLNFFYARTKDGWKTWKIWKGKKLLHHKRTNSLVIYDIQKKRAFLIQQLIWKQFFDGFRFNSVKFYRGMIQHILEKNFSFNVQYHFHRILPKELGKYQNHSLKYKRSNYIKKVQYYTQKERAVNGYYGFYPIFTIFTELYRSPFKIPPSELKEQKTDINEMISDYLEVHYPNCTIKKVPWKIFGQTIAKSKNLYLYRSSPLKFIIKGKLLETFIQIPEEIHKYLPKNYAGEFSIPFLDDNILFGSTYNPENHKTETFGGLTLSEISQNLILTGDNYHCTHIALLRLIHELIVQD
jgi:hypothetical protein